MTGVKWVVVVCCYEERLEKYDIPAKLRSLNDEYDLLRTVIGFSNGKEFKFLMGPPAEEDDDEYYSKYLDGDSIPNVTEEYTNLDIFIRNNLDGEKKYVLLSPLALFNLHEIIQLLHYCAVFEPSKTYVHRDILFVHFNSESG